MADNLQKGLMKIKNRLVILLFFVMVEAGVLVTLLLGLGETWLVYAAFGNVVIIFMAYAVCALSICPSCKQWFYRKPAKTMNGFSEEELDQDKPMPIIRMSSKCQNCGISWSNKSN